MPSRVDVIRAAFMSVVTSVLSVLVLGGLDINGELQAAITLLANNLTLVVMPDGTISITSRWWLC